MTELAVLLVAGSGPDDGDLSSAPSELFQRVLQCLQRQTIASSLELIVVVRPGTKERYRPLLSAWRQCLVLELEGDFRKSAGYAAGIVAATGDYVACIEDHCFPAPDWAEALLHGHRRGLAVAGPRVVNANPRTLVSWVDLILNYGQCLSPAGDADSSGLATQNCSYRRSALEPFSNRLAAHFEVEVELHQEMKARGEQLGYVPRAKIAHLNYSRTRPWLKVTFLSGRIYASERNRRWSRGRRAIYGICAPAIALVRLVRILRDWPVETSQLPPLARLLPHLLVGLIVDALGQAAGYWMGVGSALSQLGRYEFGRERFLSKRDSLVGMDGFWGRFQLSELRTWQ